MIFQISAHGELVERCETAWLSDGVEGVLAEVLRTLETVTLEMIDAGDDLVPIARGTESYRGFPVPESLFKVMLSASPLAPHKDEKL